MKVTRQLITVSTVINHSRGLVHRLKMHIWYTGFLFVKQGANENVFDQSNSEHIFGIQAVKLQCSSDAKTVNISDQSQKQTKNACTLVQFLKRINNTLKTQYRLTRQSTNHLLTNKK